MLPPILAEFCASKGSVKGLSSRTLIDAVVRPPRKVRRCISSLPNLYPFDLSAIHTHCCTGHPLRGRGDEITHLIGNLFRLSHASYASLLGKFLDCLFHREVWAGAHFSKNACRRPVITAPGATLLTCTPSLIPCSANALARALIAAWKERIKAIWDTN